MSISEAFAFYLSHNGQSPLVHKTHKNYRTAMNSFISIVGDIQVEFLGLDHINQYKQAMYEDGFLATSINTNLSRLRQVLKFLTAYEFKVLDYHRVIRDKELYRPKTILSPSEVTKLAEATNNKRDKALIELYFSTGCRLSEILDLDREPFEHAEMVQDGIYQVWVFGKGGKYRPVLFPQSVKDAVDAYLDTRRDYFKPLFMSNQNRRLGGSRVEKMLHEATRRAGLTKHVTPHILRHSFVTDLAGGGVPIPVISSLAGHKNASTTLRVYTHIQQHQSVEAFAKHYSR